MQRVTRNRLILLKKGLIYHFLPEFVKSKSVGGFQNRLSTLVGFKAASEPVSGSAHCCGAAVLGWRPSSLHGATLIQSLGTSMFEGIFFLTSFSALRLHQQMAPVGPQREGEAGGQEQGGDYQGDR